MKVFAIILTLVLGASFAYGQGSRGAVVAHGFDLRNSCVQKCVKEARTSSQKDFDYDVRNCSVKCIPAAAKPPAKTPNPPEQATQGNDPDSEKDPDPPTEENGEGKDPTAEQYCIARKACLMGERIPLTTCEQDFPCDEDVNVGDAVPNEQCYTNEKNTCGVALDATLQACDTSQDTKMNTAINSSNAAAQVLGGISAYNINTACNQIGNLSQAANTAVLGFQGNCRMKKTSCVESCSIAKAKAQSCAIGTPAQKARAGADIDAIVKDCQKQEMQIQSAEQSLQSLIMTGNGAVQCANASGGKTFCKQFPTNPGCAQQLAQNCTNPAYAAENKACVCVGAPMSPECRGAQKAMGAIGVGDASSLVAAGGETGGVGGLPPDMLEEEPFVIPPGQKIADENAGNGGGGGAGKMAGGGVGNQFDKKNSGGPGERQSLLQGFMSSNGGGGGLSGFVSGVAGAVRNMFGISSKEKGPDLTQFLPKANGGIIIPGRGLAGEGRPDGMTGPNGSIWLKVKNRYDSLKHTLLPTAL